MNNPYEVLRLKGWASQDEVRSAYRALVKQCHPDMIRDPAEKQAAQERMVALNLAYEEALRLSRYNRQEYLEYRNLLEQIRFRCLSRGDAEGVARCSAKMDAIPGMIRDVLAQTSALGRMIQDQPNLTLPPS